MKNKKRIILLVGILAVFLLSGVAIASVWTGITRAPAALALDITGTSSFGNLQPKSYGVVNAGKSLALYTSSGASAGSSISAGMRFAIFNTTDSAWKYIEYYGPSGRGHGFIKTADTSYTITSTYDDVGFTKSGNSINSTGTPKVSDDIMIALARINQNSIDTCLGQKDRSQFSFCATLGRGGKVISCTFDSEGNVLTKNWRTDSAGNAIDLPFINGDCYGYGRDGSGNVYYKTSTGIYNAKNGGAASFTGAIYPNSTQYAKSAGTAFVDDADGGAFYAVSTSSIASSGTVWRYRTIGFTISQGMYEDAALIADTAPDTWSGASTPYVHMGTSYSEMIYHLPWSAKDGSTHNSDYPSLTIFKVPMNDVIGAIFAKAQAARDAGVTDMYEDWGKQILERREPETYYISNIFTTRYVNYPNGASAGTKLEYNLGGMSPLGLETYQNSTITPKNTNSASSYNDLTLGGVGIYGTTTKSAHTPYASGFSFGSELAMASTMNNPITIPQKSTLKKVTVNRTTDSFNSEIKTSGSISNSIFNVTNAIPTTEDLLRRMTSTDFYVEGKVDRFAVSGNAEYRLICIYFYKDVNYNNQKRAVVIRKTENVKAEQSTEYLKSYNSFVLKNLTMRNNLFVDGKDSENVTIAGASNAIVFTDNRPDDMSNAEIEEMIEWSLEDVELCDYVTASTNDAITADQAKINANKNSIFTKALTGISTLISERIGENMPESDILRFRARPEYNLLKPDELKLAFTDKSVESTSRIAKLEENGTYTSAMTATYELVQTKGGTLGTKKTKEATVNSVTQI